MNEGNPTTVPRANRRGPRKGHGESSTVAAQGKTGALAQSPAESKELHSIYVSKKLDKDISEDTKVVHGVPLQDFVRGGRNKLPSEVVADTPNGVRVFLQCMEFKKARPTGLTETECNQLIAKNKRFGALGGP